MHCDGPSPFSKFEARGIGPPFSTFGGCGLRTADRLLDFPLLAHHFRSMRDWIRAKKAVYAFAVVRTIVSAFKITFLCSYL